MKRLILHIGTHKTGTTSLQEFLDFNAEALARQGVCWSRPVAKYPYVDRTRNGHFLYCYAKDALEPPTPERRERYEPKTKANLSAFEQDAAHHDTLLLSDERLWYQGAKDPATWDVIKQLLDHAGIDQVNIIVYLRRQDQFIASLWNQYVKGYTRLRSTLPSYARQASSRQAMDYDTCLRELERVFGRENITVRVYERSRLEGGDVRRDFCSLAGIAADAGLVFPESESNPSLTGPIAEIKRLANGVREYREAGNFLRDPSISVSALADGHDPAPSLTPELSAEVMGACAKGNARIARDYLGREDGELFTPRPVEASSATCSADPLVQDVIRVFTAALADERARRIAAEERIAKLEKRSAKLERRVAGLNASLGPLARLRRRLRRSRS